MAQMKVSWMLRLESGFWILDSGLAPGLQGTSHDLVRDMLKVSAPLLQPLFVIDANRFKFSSPRAITEASFVDEHDWKILAETDLGCTQTHVLGPVFVRRMQLQMLVSYDRPG